MRTPHSLRHWLLHPGIHIGLLFLTLLCVLTYFLAGPVFSAIEIGADEHYEVKKGLLWARGYPLYTKVWNDQPPLHTVVIGWLFRHLSPTIGVARMVSVGCALGLLSTLFYLLRRATGYLPAVLGVLFLLVAPQFLELGLSVMLELPTFAAGLLALIPLRIGRERPSSSQAPYLAASALLLAMALQIKLTATLYLLPLCAEILTSNTATGTVFYKHGWKQLLFWSTCLVGGFLILGLLLGVQYGQALDSHFSKSTLQTPDLSQYTPSIATFHTHPEGVYGAILFVLLLITEREWRPGLFPGLLLVSATLFSALQRPWWPYYYLHFAIPLAWLSALAIHRFLRLTVLCPSPSRSRWFRVVPGLLGYSLFGTLVLCGGDRFITEVERMTAKPRVEQNAMIARLKQYSGRVHWAYARSSILPFHAQLLVPPELAVLPKKRFWSGQINDRQIEALLNQYQPEIVLMTEYGQRNPFVERSHYTNCYSWEQAQLWMDPKLAASLGSPPQRAKPIP